MRQRKAESSRISCRLTVTDDDCEIIVHLNRLPSRRPREGWSPVPVIVFRLFVSSDAPLTDA